MKIDKKQFKDEGGRYLTQSLFLEFNYDTDRAVFTFDGEDKEFRGKTYISLKRLFLEFEDPHEYEFATNCLYDWEHWKRLCNNKALRKHIDEWREELEIKIRSKGMQKILDAAEDNNFQAAKYVADKGWDRKVGRPSKADREKQAAMDERLEKEYFEDIDRVSVVPLDGKRN